MVIRIHCTGLGYMVTLQSQSEIKIIVCDVQHWLRLITTQKAAAAAATKTKIYMNKYNKNMRM